MLNYGTLSPALLRLDHDGHIRGDWGQSENNRTPGCYLAPATELPRTCLFWRTGMAMAGAGSPA